MSGTGKEAERRRRVLDHAQQAGNVAKTCRYFGIGRASFYRWRQEYLKRGEPGLVPKESPPVPILSWYAPDVPKRISQQL